jgi:anti-sigma regulatory factor (Ser/Thr protein kinase)
MEIGGDWYDAADLGDGRLAVAVGDVVGRGLPAATTMGQLRAALGITALQASDAADAVGILDRYAQRVPGARCTTVAFAVVDPAHRAVSYASAGHPPPLLVTPDGDAVYLEGGRSWPLGIDAPMSRTPAARHDCPPGSLLVLYTDGLVERRGETVDAGLARLRDVVARHWNLPLRRLKQAIFAALVDEPNHRGDDIALVAVRTTGAAETLFVDAFPANRPDQAPARQRMREWLDDVGVRAEQRDAILLAVGEAVANAIDHGSGGDMSQIVRVEAALRDEGFIVSVSDAGRWQPGTEGYFSGRGRGHLLMEALVDDIDIDTDQHGTIVTLQVALDRELV